MANRKRASLEPTEDWQQLQFQLDWTEQTRYELIRPVVIFGAPPVELAKQTGVSARTIHRRVSRFDESGMQSLFEPTLVIRDESKHTGSVSGEVRMQRSLIILYRRFQVDLPSLTSVGRGV